MGLVLELVDFDDFFTAKGAEMKRRGRRGVTKRAHSGFYLRVASFIKSLNE